MGGPSEAEEEGIKNSKLGTKLTKEGVSVLEGIEADYYANPQLQKILRLQNEILSNPFTYNDQLKASMMGDATGVALRSAEGAMGQYGALGERLGIGRSAAGGTGLANLSRLMGQGGAVNAAQSVDRLAAESRLGDLNRAVQSGMGFLQQFYAPRKEVALGKMGTLSGLAQLVGADSQLAAQSTSPLDFVGSILGAGVGAFTGGAGGALGKAAGGG